ncbi:hypothetical protein BC835DRAFT_1363559 [Cytidiella melzeri]|nr:hypothetical protein BC835DRAFT_1363559 [Cytidiella melzeri]
MSSTRHCRLARAGDSVSLSLLHAATVADEAAVRHALLSGADVNTLDASGRSIVGCTLAGDRWPEVDVSDASYSLQTRLRILKTCIAHEKISLYALNAPQTAMHGVTPLGLAAWLNIPEVVQLLLEDCSGLVSVDGMDALGATPLMYAARDGSVAVVQCLLTHGARPDFRDVNHRTSIQHALRHPQVLWLCENFLRRHRARETLVDDNRRNLSQLHPELDELLAAAPRICCHPKLALKPPKQELDDMAGNLIACIRATDIQQLHSLLFSSASASSLTHPHPYLVNYPDADGCSPIHHCVSVEKPSTTVLDILYRAGADMSLYSPSGIGTPLHYLARNGRASTPFSVRAFIRHLVIDLRAPLSARDQNMETCIHVAAEHGQSLHVLAALLACDTTGAVRDLRNSRGLTAFEVAKLQFRSVFGPSAEPTRSVSSASVRTVKPSTTSAVSLAGPDSPPCPGAQSRAHHGLALTELERATLPQSIVDNLRCLLRQTAADQELGNVSSFQDLIQETESMAEDLLMHMQTRVAESAEDLASLRSRLAALDTFVHDLTADKSQGDEGSRLVAIERAWDAPDQSRRRTTDSDDSDRTAVSERDSKAALSFIQLQIELSQSDGSRSMLGLDADPFARLSPEVHLHGGLRPVKSMVNLGHHSSATRSSEAINPPKSLRPYTELPPASKSSPPTHVEKDWTRVGASKVKAWFRKKFAGEVSPKLPLIKELDEFSSADTQHVKAKNAGLTTAQTRLVLIARADIGRIRESVDTADRYLMSATRYISQARNMLDAVLQKHRNTMERARLIQRYTTPNEAEEAVDSQLIEFPPITIPCSPRDSQLIFPRPPDNLSPKSSVISFSSTLIEGEEEEPRVLRSLLIRKIERRTDDALSEIEKATTWLRIVREVTRPLRRRTMATAH